MAAQNGIMNFVGAQTGQTYSVSFYLDDTAGNPVRFSQAGKAVATSPTDWTPPEVVVLTDVIIGAASGQTTTQILRNGQPTGDYLLNAVYLASVTNRPALRVIFTPVAKMGANQLA
jgi:hypothetical protein